MVQRVGIQSHSRARRNVHPLVDKVLERPMGRFNPERRVTSQDLFDDGPNVRQVRFIVGRWLSVSSDNTIQLFVRFGLHVGNRWHSGQEPKDRSGG